MRFLGLKRFLKSSSKKRDGPARVDRDSYEDQTEYQNGHYSNLAPPRFPGQNDGRPSTAPGRPMTPKLRAPAPHFQQQFPRQQNGYHGTAASRFPVEVLVSIFGYVCPHATDDSYKTAEDTTTEGGCMLCDMRDLARLSLVCRKWHQVALVLQYRSIRLDNVHYCGMEEELQTRRKRGSFFQKQKGSPTEVPELRMRLLYRTFQENEKAADTVLFFKVPYMTRETCKQDLARLVSLTPNIRYVDLPDGVYQDEASCASLKSILYARCPDLRKMSWVHGSEKNFADLWSQPPWRNLEVMELSGMQLENADLVRVLGSLPNLQDLSLKCLPWVSDALFDPTPSPVGIFPALRKFAVEETTNISTQGLQTYLSRPIVQSSLQDLSLTNTSIQPQQLYLILALSPSLISLSYRGTVSRSIQRTEIPVLESNSLRTLRFEITDDPGAKSLAAPSPTYYSYLSSTLLAVTLPALTRLYVRDPSFHERLQEDQAAAGPFATPWSQHLTIYTKGMEHLDWTKYILKPAPGSTNSPSNLNIQPVWEMPRNSLAADFSDPRMSGFLAAAAAGALDVGDDNTLLAPPTPMFAEGKRPRASSVGSLLSLHRPRTPNNGVPPMVVTNFGDAGLAPPSPGFMKHQRKGSRDIWR